MNASCRGILNTCKRPRGQKFAYVSLGVCLALSAVALTLGGAEVAAAAPDPTGTIYVADCGANAIDVFPPGANGNVAPARVIAGSNTGLSCPADVKVDSAGDVYVANFNANTITEYGPGASGNVAPINTIGGSNTGLAEDDDISLAPDGTLYAGNFVGSPVVVFAPGASGNASPIRTIAGSNTGLGVVDGLGVDSTGTLYADNTSPFPGSIQVFAPGANGNVSPVRSIAGPATGLSGPDDVIVGFSGELFVTNGFDSGGGSAEVFAPGASGNVAPVQEIKGSNTGLGTHPGPDDLAVDSSGNIYITDTSDTASGGVGPAVLEFASGATGNVAPTATIVGSSTTFNEPEGVAVAPPPAPAFSTTASAATVALGSPAHDTATISGDNPTGAIVFKLYGPGDPTCTGVPAFISPPQTVSGNGSYTSPSFTPVAAGTYSWTALYSGDANNAPAGTACGDPAETFTVKAKTATLTGTPVSAIEGQPFSGQVATITDSNPTSTAAEYSATIDWGDGNTSAGVVSGPPSGPFTVSGSHTYTEEGSYTVTVSITDSSNPANDQSTTTTATVADAPLTSTCAASATSLQSFSGPTATFNDANSFGTGADFSATIDWGDGSPTTSGSIGGGPGLTPYTVSGNHSYAATGTYTITTTVKDDGGSMTTTSPPCSVLVFASAPEGGSFVIGDQNSGVGTSVTFWGAQWWKLNSLSGGTAPAAFKGFALKPTTPSCSISWSTDPGNSAPPPAGPLPAFMAVIVSSSISKSGSQISGNTPHIVVVQTNPGYGPNPGSAGTGKVVAQVC
jgi:sugar lactone lactonase YvrE